MAKLKVALSQSLRTMAVLQSRQQPLKRLQLLRLSVQRRRPRTRSADAARLRRSDAWRSRLGRKPRLLRSSSNKRSQLSVSLSHSSSSSESRYVEQHGHSGRRSSRRKTVSHVQP